MPSTCGSRIGPYEIIGPLGAGGMGEVHRASDPRLGRHVALKLLPAALAGDPEYMARFQREAQVLAALNHPAIAAIYGIEENAIVMELVEGPTLAERIAQGPIPTQEALPLARQIAEALEAAHEKGIIHRDLKPANVKVTPDGTVKVLDFGLAKAAEQGTSRPDLKASPTLSLPSTQAGLIMGTAAYMAPEQAAGKPVDKRADIWSFGVVLFEMLSGKQLFDGETISHTLAHVLTAPIDFRDLPPSTPAPMRELIRRCLDRNPKRRLRDIGDARITIEDHLANPAAGETPAPAAPAPVQTRGRTIAWAAAVAVAVLAAAVLGVVAWRATRPPGLRPLVRMNVELSPDAPLQANLVGNPIAISPDGMRIVATMRGADGKVRLYTRMLHQNQLAPLAGTENASTPFFSPDGQWIGFAADSKLKKISVEGGAAVTVCDAPGVRGASWGDDGNIVFAMNPSGPLSRVSSAGGVPQPLTKLVSGDRTHRWPQVLPGSRAVLFTSHSGSNNYDNANIELFVPGIGERRTLQRGGFSGRYVPTPDGSGRLIYLQDGTLFAVPFDLERLALAGAAVPVLEEVSSSGSGGGIFAVSSSGTIVYLAGKGNQGSWIISWVDASGKKQPLHAVPNTYFTPRFSPDGKRLAFTVSSGQGFDLWVKDLERDTPSRLSFLKDTNNWPVWLPDGKNIIFKSTEAGSSGLYWIRSDGAGEAHRLTEGKLDEYPYSISPDGKRLAFSANGNGGSQDLFTAPIEGDPGSPRLGKPELFLGTPFSEVYGAFSPDGRWLAYASNESGTAEVYVRPFPGQGGRWQISTGGGSFPVWSRDGRELFFRGPDQRIMAAGYAAKADTFTAAKQRVWSETQLILVAGTLSMWDLAPDGKRLAAIMPESEEQRKPATHLTFLLNFSDELHRHTSGGK